MITRLTALLLCFVFAPVLSAQQTPPAPPPATAPQPIPRDLPPAPPATSPTIWFDIMPLSPVKALAANPFLIYESRRLIAGSRDAASATLEIRTADNAKRVALIPDAAALPKEASSGSGGLSLNPDQLRRIGPLPDGDYLLAFTDRNHLRCSNVARLKINAKYDPAQEPVLRLISVPLGPGESRPSVWLIATGPKVQDDKFNNMAMAFPTLIIDGLKYNPKMVIWSGPVGPIAPGRQDMRLLHLEGYIPDTALKAHYKVKAQVLDHVSAEVTIPADDTLGPPWDKASSVMVAESQPAALLRGTVTGPDGKPAVGYEVRLHKPDGTLWFEQSDDHGLYQFANVPAGEYAIHVNPSGTGQPQLGIETVTLPAAKPLSEDFSFAAKFTLSGSVIHQNGAPAPGKEVSITAHSNDGRVEYMNFATTDARGHYSIGLPFTLSSHRGSVLTVSHNVSL